MINPSQILSEDQAKKLFTKLLKEKDKAITIIASTPHLSHPTETSTIIDFYLFSLIYNTGLRISEATHLRTSDIGEDYIIIRKEISKNKKSGTIYFGKKTTKLLQEYLNYRKLRFQNIDSDTLFPSRMRRSQYISRSRLHTRFKKWLHVCGLPHELSIHSLRHSYATRCLDKGLSLTFVRDQLRHSNISITSQYLHLTLANREKVKDLF